MSAVPTDDAAGRSGLAIRLAGPDDFGRIQELFSERDGHEWDRGNVEWLYSGLDPRHCVAWLAFDGARAVGLSAMHVRYLTCGGEARRVGYWANLYVRPSHRHLMLYPRLPHAMFQYVRAHDFAFIYCAVRLRELAATHLRIGFAKLGELTVLFKPLRPVQLLVKAWQWPAAASILGAPVDAAWRRLVARRPLAGSNDFSIELLDLSSSEVAELVAILNRRGAGRVCQAWTQQMFEYRYRHTPVGGRYRLWIARRAGRPVAAVIYCSAERGPGVVAGVIMDVIADSIDDPAVVAVIAAAQAQVADEGGDLMLYLNGLGSDEAALLRRLGYRKAPETYDLLVWPKEISSEVALKDVTQWRFGFGDHDAF
jgi:hypothetical protein